MPTGYNLQLPTSSIIHQGSNTSKIFHNSIKSINKIVHGLGQAYGMFMDVEILLHGVLMLITI